MTPETAEKLLAINRQFYADFADQWDQTRLGVWQAFERITPYFSDCQRFLDVGCGNGRLGAYLMQQAHPVASYTGVDFSSPLLEAAAQHLPHCHFVARDLGEPDPLRDMCDFDGAAMLAVLHHIPTVAKRVALLQAVYDVLLDGSYFVISNFQFLASERTRRKVVDWQEAGIDSAEVDRQDYLLNWRRGGYGLRYLNLIDAEAMQQLVAQTPFSLVESFRCDGKEGNLNLYSVLQK